MEKKSTFKLTYATMFNPPEELHAGFDQALASVKAKLGLEYGMIIDGQERLSAEKLEVRTPIDTDVVLGLFQKGTVGDAHDALAAARKAFSTWRKVKWQERVAMLRKAADLIEERLFMIGAVTALEVGKNRMESLGEIAETADLIRYPCNEMERHNGYLNQLLPDPVMGFQISNHAVMRPYGVWVVISPFNFPCALIAGPAAAAMVAGNTVVMKPSPQTPWAARLFAECLRDAGVPDGVFNFVTGPDETLGQALVDSPEVDGITFTGSHDVGMMIYRRFAERKYVHPVILEMGGKNPAIVSRNADVEDAAIGIVRAAYGLQGQKCSACSRVYVEETLHDVLLEHMVSLTSKLVVGDPTHREVYMGPLNSQKAYGAYQDYIKEIIADGGEIVTGGEVMKAGDLKRGYYCSPTIATELPLSHRLNRHEMFGPIVTVGKVQNLEEAMREANDIDYGLTAGFFGTEGEGDWFLDHIQAGVVYVNRSLGATAGAYPNYQTFGGWKGSGSSGKNGFGQHYLQLYMHEQSRTVVKRA